MKNSDKKKKTQAQKSDRFRLYEQSVQCPEADLDFVSKEFRRYNKRSLFSIREDFCASASICYEWVRRHRKNHAVGVDLDTKVLDWGRKHHAPALRPSARKRLSLIHGDVIDVRTRGVEAILALNFSYFVFQSRADLKKYFRKAADNLEPGGLLVLDAFGGSEALLEKKEKTDYKKYSYVWDQAHFDPATHHMICHIHFRFPDKSQIRKAFSYDWRFWSLPEITELLTEAGLRPTVYWEGEDKKGEGNGVYKPLKGKPATADPAWLAYIIGRKPAR